MRRLPVLIVGAGIAGLSAARVLSKARVPYLLVEAAPQIGGLCRSVTRKGHRFDYTGHFLHFKHPATFRWVSALPGLRLRPRRRHAAVYSEGVFTEYPYQENGAGLPSETLRENVMDYLLAALMERSHGRARGEPQTFEECCQRAFGASVTRRFMAPYNEKLLRTPIAALSPSWMGRFIPPARVGEVVRGALRRQNSSAGYNATFHYPLNAGIEALPRALALGLTPPTLNVGLVAVDLSRRQAVLSDGRTVAYDHLLSSAPLPALCRASRGLSASLRRHAALLRATSVTNVNLGLRHKASAPYSWVYFPGGETVFHRAGFLSECVPESAPRGGSSLYVEVSYQGAKPDPKALGRKVIADLRRLKWVRDERDIRARVDLDLPGAYVIYDKARDNAVPALRQALARHSVETLGRWGRWEYAGMEAALEQGREAAQRLL